MKALYREYRPKNFDQVYDQDSIVRILKNQVKSHKLGHAYIFSGSRGTGKTSCAKIFSRAVNCLNPIDGNPCNECENCKAILEEKTVDVVEMDAASNRRIDDIRDLRDKVIYPPSKLKYKVYIIDEAHMITNEGFNALLKIMEEPPEHLIFILATTELEKIPQTILSRTQRFEFNRISSRAIRDNLEKIAKDLFLEVDEDALDLISDSADGAMRDALSLMDQAILDKRISLASVIDIIGGVSHSKILDLTEKILADDPMVLSDIYDLNADGLNLLRDLISVYRYGMFIKAKIPKENLHLEEARVKKIETLFSKTSLDRIVDSLKILLEYENLAKKSDNQEILLELCIVRLIDYVDKRSIDSRLNALERKVFSENTYLIKDQAKDQGKNREVLTSRSEEKKEESLNKLNKTGEIKENILQSNKEEGDAFKQDREKILTKTHEEERAEDHTLASREDMSELELLYAKKEKDIQREIESDTSTLYDLMIKGLAKIKFHGNKIFYIYDRAETFTMKVVDAKRESLEKAISKVINKEISLRIVEDGDFEIPEENPTPLQKLDKRDLKNEIRDKSELEDGDLEKDLDQVFGLENIEFTD